MFINGMKFFAYFVYYNVTVQIILTGTVDLVGQIVGLMLN